MMESLIQALTYISIFSGGLLMLMLLLSFIGGLDFDFDLDLSDADAGGLGVFKSVLTFISISTWVAKIVIVTSESPTKAVIAGIVSGAIAVLLMVWFVNLLLKNQRDASWFPENSEGKRGIVYLKIPAEGEGIVNVKMGGAIRELKAKAINKKDIATGSEVIVHQYVGGYAEVSTVEKVNI